VAFLIRDSNQGVAMSDVLQCPYCDLRFSTSSELEQHKTLDHRRAQEDAPKKAQPDPASAQPEEHVEKPRGVDKKKVGFLSRLFKRS
jgi:hypothetical protein